MVPGKNDYEYITSLEPAFFSKEKVKPVEPAKVLTAATNEEREEIKLQTSLEKKTEREKLPFKKFSIINPVPDKEIPESLRSWLESETGETISVDDIIEVSSKYKYNLNTIPMGRLGSSQPDFSLIADPASVVFKNMTTFEKKAAVKHLAAVGLENKDATSVVASFVERSPQKETEALEKYLEHTARPKLIKAERDLASKKLISARFSNSDKSSEANTARVNVMTAESAVLKIKKEISDIQAKLDISYL